MSAVDFHQILGVEPDASAAEIKRAYRRLAMRWHPDRNPDPTAHDQFRRVREAFERLTQPVADELDDDAATEPPPPHKQRQSRPRGTDHRQDVTVDLTEAAHGTTVTVTIEGREPCDDCDGSGERSYGRTSMCGSCHGSGRLRSNGKLETCGDCGGKGFTTDNSCPSCQGRGWQPADRQLAVTVPPAMLPGEELRIAGQGGPAPDGGDPGDLYLTLRTRPHPLFRLQHHDLHVAVPVSIFRLLAGGTIEVPTLTGLHDVLLPEAAASAEIRVPGAGFPARGRRKAGDLVVHLAPQHPAFLSKEQKAMLEMAEQVLQHQLASQSPALAAWNDLLDAHR